LSEPKLCGRCQKAMHLRSAGCHQLFVPRHRRSMFGRRAFSVAGPATWNSLKLNSTTRTRHGPDPTRTKSAHVVGYELNSTTRTRHGPDRTRTDFCCGETPLGPCGSGRVRVVEFSYYQTTCEIRHVPLPQFSPGPENCSFLVLLAYTAH